MLSRRTASLHNRSVRSPSNNLPNEVEDVDSMFSKKIIKKSNLGNLNDEANNFDYKVLLHAEEEKEDRFCIKFCDKILRLRSKERPQMNKPKGFYWNDSKHKSKFIEIWNFLKSIPKDSNVNKKPTKKKKNETENTKESKWKEKMVNVVLENKNIFKSDYLAAHRKKLQKDPKYVEEYQIMIKEFEERVKNISNLEIEKRTKQVYKILIQR